MSGYSLILTVIAVLAYADPMASSSPLFTYRQVMIPMRDGVCLQTVILTPTQQTAPLPVLFTRSPYGVPDRAPATIPTELAALARDGYIFVFQNVRGRFKSEGAFGVTTLVTSGPRAVNDATDAYDTIEWLVKHVPGNNGRVGMWGVSYAGMTAAMALLDPPPELKAVSEQGAAADEWMNDDFHHYGGFRLSYAFEYAVQTQAHKYARTPFQFDKWDTYEWYLDLGPLSNVNRRYLHGALSFWNDVVEHPDYDEYWQKDDWARLLHGVAVPILNVAGYWDQEDPWGPWRIFRSIADGSPGDTNLMVAGPWSHGAWATRKRGDNIGLIPMGHDTSREFREAVEAPFFRYYLHGTGKRPDWKVASFQTGSNTWQRYLNWPPRRSGPVNLYLHNDGSLSFNPPHAGAGATSYRRYPSDPADPVPYARRPVAPISPFPADGQWATWEVADQRFVDHRPDVLTYLSPPLAHAVTVTGPLTAVLYASTSGTDCDFVVKLIDAYPEDDQKYDRAGRLSAAAYHDSLNGYELPVAMEIRRGRYLKSFSHPAPLRPNVPVTWRIPLGDHDHVFEKGHRIMVQIQSTWFPLYDRNPQKFVANIYRARPGDYVTAFQRIYASAKLRSRVILSVVRTPERSSESHTRTGFKK